MQVEGWAWPGKEGGGVVSVHGPKVHGCSVHGVALGLDSGRAEWGGELRLLLMDEAPQPFLFSRAFGGLAADGRLVPCVRWSWRTGLDSEGQVGRGRSMVVTATGWGASLQPHCL